MAGDVKPVRSSAAAAEAELQARFRHARRQRRIRQGMKRIIMQDLGGQLSEIVEEQFDQIVAVLNAGGLVNVNVAIIVPADAAAEGGSAAAPDEAAAAETPTLKLIT